MGRNASMLNLPKTSFAIWNSPGRRSFDFLLHEYIKIPNVNYYTITEANGIIRYIAASWGRRPKLGAIYPIMPFSRSNYLLETDH
jgi:hypothetical protein